MADEIMGAVAREREELLQRVQEALPPGRTLAEILEDPKSMEAPQTVVPRLAWRGRATMLSAREKIGKTTLLTAGAARVTDGGLFLDGRCPRGTVLWFALEEHPGDYAPRALNFSTDPDRLVVVEAHELLDNPVDRYHEAVEEYKPDLIVVDNLAAFVDLLPDRPDPGNSSAWTPILRSLIGAAREHDAALVLIHHGRKSDGAYRDSTAIGASVDVILEMSEGTDSDTRKIKARGRFAVEDFSVRYIGDRFELAGGTVSLDAQVLRYVQAHPGCSMRQVRDNVTGKAADISNTIKKMLAADLLEDHGTKATGFQLHAPGGGGSQGGSRRFSGGSQNEGGGSAENPHGTATEPVSGTSGSEVVPRGGGHSPPSVGTIGQEPADIHCINPDCNNDVGRNGIPCSDCYGDGWREGQG